MPAVALWSHMYKRRKEHDGVGQALGVTQPRVLPKMLRAKQNASYVRKEDIRTRESALSRFPAPQRLPGGRREAPERLQEQQEAARSPSCCLRPPACSGRRL
ncbi:hypothetical protein JEQ12_001979 [Ovis aries]|uniref:Uncharacterized protein n=1 Tax=Ovis aries TaxID=9940 RepID=A0A836AKH3_SHEEP|nr:hypothetical protein JEQ12_001979 [Ovis aries]